MRVLWASHSGRIGGAELCLLEGARALRALGVDLLVTVPERAGLDARLREAGILTAQVPLPWWVRPPTSAPRRVMNVASTLRRGLPLLQVIRRFRPDVVLTNTIVTPTAAVVARAAGVPHVWFVHEYGDRDHGYAFDFGHRASMAALRRLSRRVLVNSPALVAHFRPHLRGTPLDAVHYAVEVPEGAAETSPVGGRLRLAMVGARHPGKRQEDAIRALGLLRRRGVDARLTLVGPSAPDYEARLLQLAQAEGVGDVTAFVGHTDHPYAHYADADVSLMCSANEAFGRVTVEAMKLGVPVVGAASGGTADLIRDGWNGRLYRPADPADLADTLQDLNADRPALRTMGERARAWARAEFTMERYGDELLASLEQAVHKP